MISPIRNHRSRLTARLFTTSFAIALVSGCVDSPVAPPPSAHGPRLNSAPAFSISTVYGGYIMTELEGFGGDGTSGININDRGDVVGQGGIFDPLGTLRHAAVWPAAGGLPRDLGTLGGRESFAYGINDAGDAVGFATPPTFGFRAAFYPAGGGTPRDLGTLGGPNSEALAINNAGVIVGQSSLAGNLTAHAVVWQTPAMLPRDLGSLGGSYSMAVAINDAGTSVGDSDLPGNTVRHATLWPAGGGAPRDLGSPGGGRSTAADINNVGDVVGWSVTTGTFSSLAVLWPASGGPPRILPTLGGQHAFANSINDRGDAVGYAYVAPEFGDQHAVLWPADGSGPRDLHPPGAFRSIAIAINNDGKIVGWYISPHTGDFIPVTWTPVTTPVVGAISAPAVPVQVNTTVPVSASFTDAGRFDTHTATINWGDGSTSPGTITESNGSGSVSASHAYTAPGVYAVTMTVTDQLGISGESVFNYVVAFDPAAGFVTGAGWITSPAGAYVADPTLAGRAKFGFVSRYQKGTSVPEGNTQFQFDVAGLSFKSTSYEWLVIAGATAKFKGAGTINDVGDYGFMLSALDGDKNAKGDPDRFRIKIWNKTTGAIVYDNQAGSADDAEASTAIGGGSIAVHQ